ncbi:hypothetical protein [Rhodovibrio salinarum]|uniref:Uncharacterized protein n=1 Tax=Rhodovibrio salinarum TaxID=1087 RepID=A0A934V291_9PROT|nr:hypothetical protein [Rhodovibrio salinarum]MBK1698669.1 hypothetical protein [Rhodovibrio salinarum]
MLSEGQRFALLDHRGRRVEEWEVAAIYRARGVRTRATLIDPDDQFRQLELAADDLSDRRRFRPVPAMLRHRPLTKAV